MTPDQAQALRDAVQTARMEATLGMWLAGIAVTLALVLGAVMCHVCRDLKARVKLAEHGAELPDLQQRQDKLTDSVTQSALAADHAHDGECRPPVVAETRTFGVQNGFS